MYSPFLQWKTSEGTENRNMKTHRDKDFLQFVIVSLRTSYPVLLVLLLVLCVSVHVGAHTGMTGCTGDAADAVGRVLPPDAQVRLRLRLRLLRLLGAPVAAAWGKEICVFVYELRWTTSFIRYQTSTGQCWYETGFLWRFTMKEINVLKVFTQKSGSDLFCFYFHRLLAAV